MTVRIGSNPASLLIQRNLANATTRLSASYERLASGQRINKASDDAAGLAVSSTLNSNARVYGQGIRNLNDGISYLHIADSALQQLSTITMRQPELAEQAASGAYSLSQRRALNNEADKLVDEFNRIVQSTEFNGRKLIDVQQSGGDVRVQAGFGSTGSVLFALGNELDRTAGTGSFSLTQNIGTILESGAAVAAGDIDGDGWTDFVAAGWQDTSGRFGTTLVYKNNGNGTFSNTSILRTNLDGGTGDSKTHAVALVDVNSDGSLDLIASGSDQMGGPDTGMTRIFLNNGSGTFTLKATLTSNPTGGVALAKTSAIATGDINGDGKVDLVTGGTDDDGSISYGMSRVYLGDGAGNFSLGVVITSNPGTSSETQSIALADMNNDGALDLLAAGADGTNGRTRLFTNDGGGNFAQTSLFISNQGAFSSNTYSVAAADLNRDGYSDIITAGQEQNAGGATYGATRVFLSQGNGTYGLSSVYTTNIVVGGGCTDQAFITDLNGDGTDDFAAGGLSGLDVFLGNGSGTFAKLSSISTAWVNGLSLADFSRDGAPDIVSISDGEVKIFRAVSNQTTSIGYYNLLSTSSARVALDTLRDQLSRIASERGAIGAIQSRLGAALSTVSAVRENNIAAASRITDVDVAQESAALVNTQILQEAASSVLAQANQTPSLALALLKG